MTAQVETGTIEDLISQLQSCEKDLSGSTEDIARYVLSAGSSLEGRQYSLSVEETKASCSIINASAQNVAKVISYLNALLSDLNDYLGCTY